MKKHHLKSMNVYIYTGRGFVMVEAKDSDRDMWKTYDDRNYRRDKSISTLPLFAWTYLKNGGLTECFDESVATNLHDTRRYKPFRENIQANIYVVLIDGIFAPYPGMTYKEGNPKLLKRMRGSVHQVLRFLAERDKLFFYSSYPSSYELFVDYYRDRRLYAMPMHIKNPEYFGYRSSAFTGNRKGH